jgi:hypothetical protein
MIEHQLQYYERAYGYFKSFKISKGFDLDESSNSLWENAESSFLG